MASPVATNTPALPPLPLPGAKPREIRAALHPEYHNEFDRDYQEALDEAGRTLDLECVHDTLEHCRVVRRAVELLTGQEPPTDEPVAVTEARL